MAHFGRHAEAQLQRLHESLRDGTYRPQPVRRVWIAQVGRQEKRPFGLPAVRDRIAQGALRHVLTPIFQADMAEHSYGFRPGARGRGRAAARGSPAPSGALLRSALLALLAEHHPDEPLPQIKADLHAHPSGCLSLINS